MKVLVICGLKNTGKTTVMSYVIKQLSKKGYRVAAIKHDGHDFDLDNENRDNVQHYLSGASQSIVFSSNRYMMIKNETVTIKQLLNQTKDNDLVLIEGLKDSDYYKLEMLKAGNQEKPVSNPVNRLGVICDFDYQGNERVFNFHQLDDVVLLIEKYLEDKL